MEVIIEQRVAYLAFDRPEHLNSITETVIEELEQAVATVAADSTLVALVVQGTGKGFCVGLDIELLERAFEDPKYFESILVRFGKVLLNIEALDLPVIAVVSGITRAGGFELMLACDLVLAAQEARIGDVHTSFGVLPGGGSTQRLPRKIGEQKAKELIFTGRWLTGSEAHDYGLVLDATPLSELPQRTDELLEQLRDKPSSVLRAAKRVIRAGLELPLSEALNTEIQEFLVHLTADPSDPREGFRASREGRRPNWH